jgi:peptidylprolyl isomerase
VAALAPQPAPVAAPPAPAPQAARAIDGGLLIQTLVPGTGDSVKTGDRIAVHYIGFVQKAEIVSAEPFDDSRARETPLTFALGAGEVIRGWDSGLQGMRVGEKRMLVVPPSLAYGDRDLGIIPPNSTLRFEVELLSFEKGQEPDRPFSPLAVEWRELAPGVQAYDLRAGSGEKARPGDELTLHFTGWLGGGAQFQTTRTSGKPVTFTLGAGEVIDGWEQGLRGLQAGGVRLLRVQSYAGYGSKATTQIPPNSTLLFTVELVKREGAVPSEGIDVFPDTASIVWQAGPEGLRFAVTAPASDPAAPVAQPGQTVRVHYTGWLLDGTRFDSSRNRGQPFDFALDAGQVVRGWDLGVNGMRKGEKRLLMIPAPLGYGTQGAGPIPPNATLLFAVELMDLE